MTTRAVVQEAEYTRRLEKVRARMADRSFAALVVTDPANICYLTGYNAVSYYMPQCLVVPAEGDIVLFARAMDANGALRTAQALRADQVEGYSEELVHQPDRHPFDWISRRMLERELVPTEPRHLVGIESDSHYFSPRAYLALRNGLPGLALQDSRELVNWVRLVKSPAEVEHMRIAGTIAQRAMEVALDAVRPGRRQCDVVAEILAAQACGTPEHGGDYPALVPMLPTGEAAGTPHLTWTDDVFREGEATAIELAGVYRRYHAPLARTIMLGEPPDRLIDTAAAVTEGMGEVLHAAKPGRTVHELHALWDAVIRSYGLTKESRIGYSIGLGYPPDWGEHTISLRDGEHTELQAGMCFHVILGMWMDNWGYTLSEPIVVTEDGTERLTDLPQQLTIRK
ncbi:MAG: M24 family metallopeptidase [Actinomycetota bacterium]